MGNAFLTPQSNVKWSDINTLRNCNCSTSGIVYGDTTSLQAMYNWYLTNAFLPSDDGGGTNPMRAGEFKCGQIMTGEISTTPETPVSPYNDNNNGRVTASLLPEGVVNVGSTNKCYEFYLGGTQCGPQSGPSATFTGIDCPATCTVTLKDSLTQSCIVQSVGINLGGNSNFYRQLQNNTC